MKAHFYSFDGEREQLRFTLVLKDGKLSSLDQVGKDYLAMLQDFYGILPLRDAQIYAEQGDKALFNYVTSPVYSNDYNYVVRED